MNQKQAFDAVMTKLTETSLDAARICEADIQSAINALPDVDLAFDLHGWDWPKFVTAVKATYKWCR